MTTIDIVLLIALIFLIITLLAGLARSVRGPSLQDRMLSVQLLGTGGVALLLLMAGLRVAPALIDVALVLALLAVVAAAALTRRETEDD